MIGTTTMTVMHIFTEVGVIMLAAAEASIAELDIC